MRHPAPQQARQLDPLLNGFLLQKRFQPRVIDFVGDLRDSHDGSVCMLYEWFAIHHQQKPQFCERINLPAPYGSVMGHGSMLRELRDQSNNPIVV